MKNASCMVLGIGLLVGGCAGDPIEADRTAELSDRSDFSSTTELTSGEVTEELAARAWISEDPTGLRRFHLRAYSTLPEGVQEWKHRVVLDLPITTTVDDGVVVGEVDPSGSAVWLDEESFGVASARFYLHEDGTCSGEVESTVDGASTTVQVTGLFDRVVCDLENGVSAIGFEGGFTVPCTASISE